MRVNSTRTIIREEVSRILGEDFGSDDDITVESCDFRNMEHRLEPNPIVLVDIATVGSYRDAKFELVDTWSFPIMLDGSEVVGFGDPDHVDQLSFKIDGGEDEDAMYEITNSNEVIEAARDCLSDAVDDADRNLRRIIEDELEESELASRDPYGYRGVSQRDFYESRRKFVVKKGKNRKIRESNLIDVLDAELQALGEGWLGRR